MPRLQLIVLLCVLTPVVACASRSDSDHLSEDPPVGDIGQTAQAVGTPFDLAISTRDQRRDNILLAVPAPVGIAERVPDVDAGFCWVTSISGSFRGSGEFAKIDVTSGGYYTASVKSVTMYDGVSGVGPAMTMRCRHLTDFVSMSQVASFSTQLHFVTDDAFAGGTSYGVDGVYIDGKSMWPWGGIDGRLGPAGNIQWDESSADRSLNGLYISWATSCPLPSKHNCSMTAYAWETSSEGDGYPWQYSVVNVSAMNDADIALVPAASQECFVDGVFGHWTGTTSARVQIEADNKWHLVTQRGSSQEGMGAWVGCFPLNQSF